MLKDKIKKLTPYTFFILVFSIGLALLINGLVLRNTILKNKINEMESERSVFEAERDILNKNIDSLITAYKSLELSSYQLKSNISLKEQEYKKLKNEYNKYRNGKKNNARSFTVHQLDSFWTKQN